MTDLKVFLYIKNLARLYISYLDTSALFYHVYYTTFRKFFLLILAIIDLVY